MICRYLNHPEARHEIATFPSESAQKWIDRETFGEPLGHKAITTWSPSHVELGYLAEVLRYANIIDGLSEEEKRDLRYDLEIIVGMTDIRFGIDVDRMTDINYRFAHRYRMYLIGDKETLGKIALCAELCPEYIDYLEEILKPYLKD
jgi:hypothetical protein